MDTERLYAAYWAEGAGAAKIQWGVAGQLRQVPRRDGQGRRPGQDDRRSLRQPAQARDRTRGLAMPQLSRSQAATNADVQRNTAPELPILRLVDLHD